MGRHRTRENVRKITRRYNPARPHMIQTALKEAKT
jgi:hypothetical protein